MLSSYVFFLSPISTNLQELLIDYIDKHSFLSQLKDEESDTS